MTRQAKVVFITAVATVAGVLAGGLVLRPCTVTENHTDAYSLQEIFDRNNIKNADGMPCEKICPKPVTDRDVEYRHCAIAKRLYSPYVLCKLDVDEEFEYALPFPQQLDPDTTGRIDLKYCGVQACVERATANNSNNYPNAKVIGCRVAGLEIENEELLTCSYTILFGLFEALDIMAR